MIQLPSLESGNRTLDQAFRISLGDLVSNIFPFQDGLLTELKPVFIAGLGYVSPWTRDAAFNTWYGGGIVAPQVARNTLMSVLRRDGDKVYIGGEYWDSVIWTTGAWKYYLYTGDEVFLKIAYDATCNTLAEMEKNELDQVDGLFRGGACFQDGVAGYPDQFGDPSGKCGGIINWLDRNPDKKVQTGVGLPMKALSTNCLYYHAYALVNQMAEELGLDQDAQWDQKATDLRNAINAGFWDEMAGHYRYFVDADDTQIRQEGFGHAFAILFGVADQKQTASILDKMHRTAHGIASVWPPYERYCADGEYPRHSGTVWPQVNASWVEAMVAIDEREDAWQELSMLAEKACRDVGFYEIYHPDTGEVYGGMQEHPQFGEVHIWESCKRQTWCATGFLNMVFKTLLGMQCSTEGVTFKPWLPEGVDRLSVRNLTYRNTSLNLTIERGGEESSVTLPADVSGKQDISLSVN